MMRDVYESRRQRLCSLAVREGIDAILLVNPINILYFSGLRYNTMKRLSALVLDVSDAAATLLLPEIEGGKSKAPLREHLYADTMDAFAPLAPLLANKRRLGVEKETLTLAWADRLAAVFASACPALWDIGGAIRTLRMIKDQTEIQHLRQAASVTDDILKKWVACVSPGMDEATLRFTLDRITAELGVEESCPGIIIATGINTSAPHGLSNARSLQQNDMLYIDCGARQNNYYCDITRSFFLGKPEEEFSRIYRIVLEAQLAAIAAIAPGRPVCEVDLAARGVIEKHGYGAYFTHRTGHGLGLEVHEEPSVHAKSSIVLQPGMVITVEPGIYLPGRGGIRIEDDLLVTQDGRECLTHFPKSYDAALL